MILRVALLVALAVGAVLVARRERAAERAREWEAFLAGLRDGMILNHWEEYQRVAAEFHAAAVKIGEAFLPVMKNLAAEVAALGQVADEAARSMALFGEAWIEYEPGALPVVWTGEPASFYEDLGFPS